MTLQKKLRIVHLWLGLIAGLFIVMMTVSGLIIVFRPQFEKASAPKVAPGAIHLSLIEQSLGAGTRIRRVAFPESPTEPLLVQTDKAQEFFDGSTGRDLGPQQKIAWLNWVIDLHQNLLLGKTGRLLTALIGIPLLLLSLTGLWSWFAGKRDWKRALAVPAKGPWRRVNFHAHKWVGLWVNAFLIVVSFTGIVLAYPNAFQRSIRATPPKPPMSKKVLPLDEYLRAASQSVPGGIVRELRMTSRGNTAVSVVMWAPGDFRPKGGTVVWLDPASAQLLTVQRSSNGPVELANAIHKTEWGGLLLKFPWAILGLAPIFLMLSGVQIWWNQRVAQRKLQERAGLPLHQTPTVMEEGTAVTK
jgi:uncharacterized iron-regulated membrane protein